MFSGPGVWALLDPPPVSFIRIHFVLQPLFSVQRAHIFSVCLKKKKKPSDFSHQVQLIELLLISLSCHCMWIKAVTRSFLLADNIKAICLVCRDVRSAATGEHRLENARATVVSMNNMKDRGREPAWQHVGGKKNSR